MYTISEEAIERNEHLRAEVGDYTIWQFVTRGKGRWTHDAGPPAVCVKVGPIDYGRFGRFYESGAHGVIPRTRSYSAESLDPKVKHFSRMNFNLAELEVADIDPHAWPIMMDVDGNITEGTGYNVFMVKDGAILTPGDRSILQGVSRKAVFDFAGQLNIHVLEEDLQPYDVYTADEVFFSGTSPCVLPVTRVDNRVVADGKPGPITRQLLAAWSENVGMDIVDQAVRFDRG
jgi:branched-chain amino acid aminotransferase